MLVVVTKQINGGKPYYYPVNEIAHGLCEFIGQKTLTPKNVEQAKRMGYQVQIVGEVPSDTRIKPQE